ncbi:DUF6572 domain-containing protein [Flavobacterium olei]
MDNGQLGESYPDKAEKKNMIQIVFKYQPNKIEFLAVAERSRN